MSNASLQSNAAQEMARRRVTEELLPRQSRLNDRYGPHEPTIPDNAEPYQTFEQPSDGIGGIFDLGYGDATASDTSPSVSDSAPSSGVPSSVANASAVSNAVNSPMGMVVAALAPFGIPAAMAMNANANNTMDSFLADQALAESQVSLDAFGPTDGVDGASNGVAVAADGPAPGSSNADGSAATGDGGGGAGGGGGKIVCTAMNEAYGFGSYRQAIWLNYSARYLTKQHERGYHRIFKPLVRYAFHSGNGFAKRNVRRFLEYIMRLRTADLKAEMHGKNPHPVQRVIRRVCESICYMVGKL